MNRVCMPVMAALVLLSGTALCAEWQKTIPVQYPVTIEINLPSANVEVIGWDRKEVRLESDEEQGPPVAVESDEGLVIQVGGVRDKGDEEEHPVLGGWSFGDGDLKIQVPKETEVHVVTTSGDLAVTGVTGRCRIKSVSGNVVVKACHGPLDVKTVSGDVTVREARVGGSVKTVSGNVEVDDAAGDLLETKTVSGDVKLSRCQVKQVRLKSHSGYLRFTGAVPASGSLEAKTFSGDVLAILPAGANFDLEASTRSGDVRVDYDLKVSEKASSSVTARAGNGGADLQLGSFSGDVIVQASN